MEQGGEKSRAGYHEVSGRNVPCWTLRTTPAMPPGRHRSSADSHCYLAGGCHQEGLEEIISSQDTSVEAAAKGENAGSEELNKNSDMDTYTCMTLSQEFNLFGPQLLCKLGIKIPVS